MYYDVMDTPRRQLLKRIKRKRLRSRCNSKSPDSSPISDGADCSPNNSHGSVLHLLCSSRPLQSTPLRCISQNYENEELEKLIKANQYESPVNSPGGSREGNDSQGESLNETVVYIRKQVRKSHKRRKKEKSIPSPIVVESMLDREVDCVSLEETNASINRLWHKLEQITSLKKSQLNHGPEDTPLDVTSNPPNSNSLISGELSKSDLFDDSTCDDLLLQCLEDAENDTIVLDTPKKVRIIKNETIFSNTQNKVKSTLAQEISLLSDDDDEYFLSVKS